MFNRDNWKEIFETNAPVGSSANNTFGSAAIALAIATRCFCKGYGCRAKSIIGR